MPDKIVEELISQDLDSLFSELSNRKCSEINEVFASRGLVALSKEEKTLFHERVMSIWKTSKPDVLSTGLNVEDKKLRSQLLGSVLNPILRTLEESIKMQVLEFTRTRLPSIPEFAFEAARSMIREDLDSHFPKPRGN